MNKDQNYYIERLEQYKKDGLLLSKLFSSDNLFYRSSEESISYSTFLNDCIKHANNLSEHVLNHNRVAVSLSNPKEYLKTVFSLWMLKKSAVLLSSKMPDSEISNKMNSSNTSLLISDDSLINSSSNSTDFVEHQIDINKESLIVFTSGSSGGSKGVRLCLRNLLASALGTIHAYNFDEDDSWLLSLPLHHVGGLLIPFRALLVNASIINSNPGDLLEDIQIHKPSFMSLVSTQLQRLINSPKGLEQLKNTKAIILGGGPCSDALLKEAQSHNLKLANSYGQTETAAQVCSTKITSDINELKSVGRALLFRELEVVDSIIHIKGETVSLGYIQDSKETAFQDDTIITTDLGEFDSNDNLFIKGRSDQVFISGGENINPNEIELVIKQYEGIQEAIVVPVFHNEFGQVPFAFISSKFEIELGSLKEFIKDKLSSFQCPKDFFSLDKLPDPNLKGSIKYKRSDLKHYANKLYIDPSAKFNCIKQGNLNGETLIFLHGFMGDCNDFSPIICELEKKFFCVSIDLPGHGKTSSDNFSDLDDVLKSLLDQIRLLGDSSHLLGYSQGGRIAFGLALKDPSLFKSLIIESSNPGIEDEQERVNRYNNDLNLLKDLNSPDDIKEFLKKWYQAKLFANISKNPKFNSLLELRSKSNSDEWKKSLSYLSVGIQPNYWSRLDGLDKLLKCHVISSELDVKYSTIADRLSKQFNFTSRRIKNCGHNAHFEQPKAFMDILLPILSSK